MTALSKEINAKMWSSAFAYLFVRPLLERTYADWSVGTWNVSEALTDADGEAVSEDDELDDAVCDSDAVSEDEAV